MAIYNQLITDKYAIYHGDCIEVMKNIPDKSVHFTIYSPPFGGLYQYSSDERDLSNCLTKEEFFEHYEFSVKEKTRITLPGRMSAVHCTDIPTGNSGLDHLIDFPGDLIRLHEKYGWEFVARHFIWKEPLLVRNRTMTKSLSHRGITEDSTRSSIANADQLLIFRNKGKNPIPVTHPNGLTYYAGETQVPKELLPYRGWKGSQLENFYSHWIWRRYADAFWLDVRIDEVLEYKAGRDEDDEKHVHPLQLDVIERGLQLYCNPGETALTPYMGVGSEVFGSVRSGRRAIGIELKESYYNQTVKNLEKVEVSPVEMNQIEIF
jgi:DNA modification methylase